MKGLFKEQRKAGVDKAINPEQNQKIYNGFCSPEAVEIDLIHLLPSQELSSDSLASYICVVAISKEKGGGKHI